MMEDPLAEATQALRELTTSEEDGRRTRAAILSKLAKREARPFRPVLWFPLAALLIGSTAFAASQGAFAGLMNALRGPSTGSSGEAPMPRMKALHKIPKPPPVPAEPGSALTAPEMKTPVAKVAPPSAATSHLEPSSAHQRVNNTQANIPGSVEGPSVELSAYRAAHSLHFQAHNWAAAAKAWSRYLELAPTGSLAPEARFNRALCWVRMGDIEQAKVALAPFATGQVGGYRQAEATALLAALNQR
ncbi:MAG: hypothetical protein SFV15_02410 [Polyangiaceae bacterium]|nr:hypothetical protein [Polyangiaceae bacterium]